MSSRNWQPFWSLCFALALGTASNIPAIADSITLVPKADTTLIEGAPDNNLGSQPFFNVGTTEHFSRNRGLFNFDLGTIPAGSKLLSASLILEVVHEPSNGFESSEMELHRMLRPWGEGNKTATTSPGLGRPATTNEATWNSPFALTGIFWSEPGAWDGSDYAAETSDSVFVYGITDSPYVFSSTNLLHDLQVWVYNPATNFGWILMTTAESSPFTARRFGSREGPDSQPLLQIEYSSPIKLVEPNARTGFFSFGFDAVSGKTYSAEYKNELGNETLEWKSFTNFTAQSSTRAIVNDPTTELQRFYRIRVQ